MDNNQLVLNDSLGCVTFQPAGLHYVYDLEVVRVSDLQSRSCKLGFQRHYLYECPLIILVTEGECRQWIDFEPVDCHRGSLISVKIGQVHSLGSHSGWDGYMLLLRPEGFIQDAQIQSLSSLPAICSLNNKDSTVVEISLKQIHEDSLRFYNELSSELLRFQLHALAARLNLLVTEQKSLSILDKSGQRFLCFLQCLEQNFKQWHSPVRYAQSMACSEKTLSRICLGNSGETAKTLITKRITLEAKRLLCYSDLNVSEISEQLGFSATTYFCKFFKRETKLSPIVFRNHNGL